MKKEDKRTILSELDKISELVNYFAHDTDTDERCSDIKCMLLRIEEIVRRS